VESWLEPWLYVLGWFFLSGFALFLSYPVSSIFWSLARGKFNYGSFKSELRPILTAGAADALINMAPISVVGVPKEYVAISIIPATFIIGYIYQVLHKDWPVTRPYVFALVARLVLAGEVAAFIWSVSGVPR